MVRPFPRLFLNLAKTFVLRDPHCVFCPKSAPFSLNWALPWLSRISPDSKREVTNDVILKGIHTHHTMMVMTVITKPIQTLDKFSKLLIKYPVI